MNFIFWYLITVEHPVKKKSNKKVLISLLLSCSFILKTQAGSVFLFILRCLTLMDLELPSIVISRQLTGCYI